MFFHGQPIEKYLDAHQQIQAAILVCQVYFGGIPAPTTYDEFRGRLLWAHSVTFGASIPAIAGKIRTCDVEVGDHAHRIVCSAPQNIERDLKALYTKCNPYESISASTIEELLLRAARFLEAFFLVHPFRDGNGRVARLVVQHMFELSTTHRLAWWWASSPLNGFAVSEASLRREYIKALKYAHRHAPHSSSNMKRNVNAYNGLIRWLDRHLVARNDAEEMESEDEGIDIDDQPFDP